MQSQPLTPDEFAAKLQVASKALWVIAASVLGDRVGAEDVLQEASLVALTKLNQFDRATSFQAWMGQIVRFVALNESRRRQRASCAPVDEHSALSPPASERARRPIGSAGQLLSDQDAFDDHVVSCLKDLGETARCCLLLRSVLDMSYHEIAATLDIPEGTAMSHVHRARQAMRDRLGEQRDKSGRYQPEARPSTDSTPPGVKPGVQS